MKENAWLKWSIFSVNERTNFWRKAAITDKKEPKPQSEREAEWRSDYEKNNLGFQQKEGGRFWKGVEDKSREKEKSPELEKGEVSSRPLKISLKCTRQFLIIQRAPEPR